MSKCPVSTLDVGLIITRNHRVVQARILDDCYELTVALDTSMGFLDAYPRH
jgi:hypothetical protein